MASMNSSSTKPVEQPATNSFGFFPPSYCQLTAISPGSSGNACSSCNGNATFGGNPVGGLGCTHSTLNSSQQPTPGDFKKPWKPFPYGSSSEAGGSSDVRYAMPFWVKNPGASQTCSCTASSAAHHSAPVFSFGNTMMSGPTASSSTETPKGFVPSFFGSVRERTSLGGCGVAIGQQTPARFGVATYTETAGERGETIKSISAMTIYTKKSHEELRWEDYQRNNRGSSVFDKSHAFGGGGIPQAPSPFQVFDSATSPFGQTSSSMLNAPSAGTTNGSALHSPFVFNIPPTFGSGGAFTNCSCQSGLSSSSGLDFSKPSADPLWNRNSVYSVTGNWFSSAQNTTSSTGVPNLYNKPSGDVYSLTSPSATTINQAAVSSASEPNLSNKLSGIQSSFASLSATTSNHTGLFQTIPSVARVDAVPAIHAQNSGAFNTAVAPTDPILFFGTLPNASAAAKGKNGDARKDNNIINEEVSNGQMIGAATATYQQHPKLTKPGYYTKPSVQELAEREKAEPGYSSRVWDFVIGHYRYGSIKFKGETDVRNLDIDSIVHFDHQEVIVYKDKHIVPPLRKGLNKPAEVTLLDITNFDQIGKLCIDGSEKFRVVLRKRSNLCADFVSYDPANGEWKFTVEHFGRSIV